MSSDDRIKTGMKQKNINYKKETADINTVAKALTAVYTGVFCIDLVNDSYQVIHSPETIQVMLSGIESAQQAINLAIQKTVCEEELLDMLTFVNLRTVSKRMGTEQCLNTEYQGTMSGWVRGSFIEAERDQKGELSKVLYTYQAINEEKKKELDQIRELEENYRLTEKQNEERTASLEEDKRILTEDKRALADDLQYQNNFTKIVMEQINCGIMAYSIPGRNLLQINKEAMRIYGFKDFEEAGRELARPRKNIRIPSETDRQKLLSLREQEGPVTYQFLVNEGQPDEMQILAESKSLAGRHGGRVIISTFMDVTHVMNLEADKVSLTADNASLTADNASLTADNATLTADNATLTADNATLTADNASLTADNATLTADNASLTADNATLTADNLTLTGANTELSQAIEAVHAMLSAGSYICTYDAEGKKLLHIKYSEALKQLYGYTGEDELAGDSDQQFWLKGILPEDLNYVKDSYYAALRDYSGNTSYDVTYRCKRKDGEIRWMRAAGYVLRRANGSPITCYGLVMDVNEQKKAADRIEEALTQARLANEAKTSFLARMSHDIRTPLNGIQGLIEINEKHADDIAFTTQNRRKAKTAADHLLSLINDVLQLSKLEDPDIELAREPFHLPELLDDVFTIIELRANENGITVSRSDDPEIRNYSYMWGSPLHVRQIFINILGNSVKYNQKNGSIRTQAAVEKIGEDRILLKVVISDTGIGMSEEFQQHLFDPFTREHEGNMEKCEGTGLGMSIVKQLIDKMGGTIQVESKVNVGSRFTVEIPFETATIADMAKIEENREPGDITGKHILLVEDNELNIDIAEILLTDAGAVVTKVINGQQAVDTFRENEPGTFDVILMDVMMPVMNGYEATRQIRALDRKDAGEIPILAMTANAFAEDIEKARQAGMNDHLAKPLDIRKMLSVIARYLK